MHDVWQKRKPCNIFGHFPSFTWNSHHRNCSRLCSLMAGTRSPNLTSMTQVQDLRCSWQFLLLSRGHKLFDGSASDPAAVTVPPPLLALLHAPSYHCSDPCLELDPTPLLSLMCAHDSWRENWSATRRLGKLEETQSFWEKNQLPLFVSTFLTVKTMVSPTWIHNLESKHLTATTFKK